MQTLFYYIKTLSNNSHNTYICQVIYDTIKDYHNQTIDLATLVNQILNKLSINPKGAHSLSESRIIQDVLDNLQNLFYNENFTK